MAMPSPDTVASALAQCCTLTCTYKLQVATFFVDLPVQSRALACAAVDAAPSQLEQAIELIRMGVHPYLWWHLFGR